jgi:hypothetical protein
MHKESELKRGVLYLLRRQLPAALGLEWQPDRPVGEEARFLGRVTPQMRSGYLHREDESQWLASQHNYSTLLGAPGGVTVECRAMARRNGIDACSYGS